MNDRPAFFSVPAGLWIFLKPFGFGTWMDLTCAAATVLLAAVAFRLSRRPVYLLILLVTVATIGTGYVTAAPGMEPPKMEWAGPLLLAASLSPGDIG